MRRVSLGEGKLTFNKWDKWEKIIKVDGVSFPKSSSTYYYYYYAFALYSELFCMHRVSQKIYNFSNASFDPKTAVMFSLMFHFVLQRSWSLFWYQASARKMPRLTIQQRTKIFEFWYHQTKNVVQVQCRYSRQFIQLRHAPNFQTITSTITFTPSTRTRSFACPGIQTQVQGILVLHLIQSKARNKWICVAIC
jgi:hypothetical protein